MNHRVRVSARFLTVTAAAAASLVSLGCSRRQSAQQQLDAAFKESGMTRHAVYPFAGKVLVDGQAPKLKKKQDVLVFLCDPAKPDEKWNSRPYAVCSNDGQFSFHSYIAGDGVAAGKYVVAFVALTRNKRKGYIPPDELKNLYNDPGRNAEKFTIDHQRPGKTDYAFELELAGHEPATPGPNAITHLAE